MSPNAANDKDDDEIILFSSLKPANFLQGCTQTRAIPQLAIFENVINALKCNKGYYGELIFIVTQFS